MRAHLLDVHDALGAPAVLIRGVRLGHLPEYARTKTLNGATVPVEWMDEVRVPRGACYPCVHWDVEALSREGVTPREPDDTEPRNPEDEPDDPHLIEAARALGLAPGQTNDPDKVQRAYRAAAVVAHPDHGGSHEAMVRLNAARDALVRSNVGA